MNARQPGRDASPPTDLPPAEPIAPLGADPAIGRRRFQVPALAVLALFVAGMVVAASGHWRRGAFVMGAAALAAGVVRWVLPTRWAGMLAVRKRWFDVLCMLGAGAVIWLVALVVPPK
ncbi:DUF3017 domain-containing protein [Propionibacterium australiense]|uniref:DUF3017 domain-containing protein n=2 Tax=Propionibacterium australiense TaxID=119981 RepID=A0A383S444_9ACTN|nr:DUF3017 domain-containing protein [Propionibacterium australiense]SYZ32775.1 Protein of unknown function DUF3017 [Propionibacterium australiense]VEH91276.1 Protein of uncharacterised function (DUF3017) [Propionibacterium australiense]